MEPAKEEKTCPQCGDALEQGKGMQFFSMLPCEIYLCKACNTLFTHDLQFLARFIGG